MKINKSIITILLVLIVNYCFGQADTIRTKRLVRAPHLAGLGVGIINPMGDFAKPGFVSDGTGSGKDGGVTAMLFDRFMVANNLSIVVQAQASQITRSGSLMDAGFLTALNNNALADTLLPDSLWNGAQVNNSRWYVINAMAGPGFTIPLLQNRLQFTAYGLVGIFGILNTEVIASANSESNLLVFKQQPSSRVGIGYGAGLMGIYGLTKKIALTANITYHSVSLTNIAGVQYIYLNDTELYNYDLQSQKVSSASFTFGIAKQF